MTVPPRPSRYAGFEGLYQADPVELATITFVNVFAGATVGAPVRPLNRVDEVVAWLAGIDLSTGLLGTTDRNTWELLQPYVLETLALWQQARVAAARTTGGDYVSSLVSLLRRGEQVLGSTDPSRTMRELLEGVELR